jgi:hypothetical protein
MGVCFQRGPAFKNMEGRFFLREFDLEKFYEVFERYAKFPADRYLSP